MINFRSFYEIIEGLDAPIGPEKKVAGEATPAKEQGQVLFAHSRIDEHRVGTIDPALIVVGHSAMGDFVILIEAKRPIIKLT